jgi:hypothetical protein
LPIATTAPFGIAVLGVVSRITAKPGVIAGCFKVKFGRGGTVTRSRRRSQAAAGQRFVNVRVNGLFKGEC